MMHHDHTRVLTSSGLIQGCIDNGVSSWKGIPYALPLADSSWFSPPQPVRQYENEYDATVYSGICPQRSLLRKKYSAACLTLNIWSPQADHKRRPVLFYIHGGSFTHGSGSESYYHGAYLSRTQDIVVVTCNYRLGIFGFLDFSLLNQEFSGNNGLRDVLTALAWVHDHIEDFGGDPQNVTVVGQSAGATLVSALVTMECARPFMAQAMMMSGGPTQLQSVETCRNTTKSFLENSGITREEQLLEQSIDDLIGLQKQFIHAHGMGAATFRITRDGDLVPQLPIAAAKHGQVKIPMLIGTTREEMGFMAIRPLARLIDVTSIIQKGLSQEDPKILRELEQAYDHEYGEHRSIPMMYSDLLFRVASMWFAQAASPHTNVWMYRFDFESRALRMNGMHAVHASDIPYLFGNFTPVAVRSLFALDRDKSAILAVADELQHDVVQFMRSGRLPWDVCTDHSAMGKCYDDSPWYEPMIHDHIAEIYAHTAYYRNSFAGIPL